MATNLWRRTVLDLDQGRLIGWRVDATSERSLESLRGMSVTIEEPKARHFQSCLDSDPGLDAQDVCIPRSRLLVSRTNKPLLRSVDPPHQVMAAKKQYCFAKHYSLT